MTRLRMVLGFVYSILRENCIIFRAEIVSKLRISRMFRLSGDSDASNTGRIFKKSISLSSAATTWIISGSSGRQTYASAKVPPGRTLPTTLLLPHISPSWSIARPESTTPIQFGQDDLTLFVAFSLCRQKNKKTFDLAYFDAVKNGEIVQKLFHNFPPIVVMATEVFFQSYYS